MLEVLATEGSPGVAAFAALALIGGLLLEKLLIRLRFTPYFKAGFPLVSELVPLPATPEEGEEGRTASVQWDAPGGGLVRFWTASGAGTAPMLLHGALRLRQTPRGFSVAVRWSPPWSPLLAAGWLALLGIARGEAHVTGPISAVMVLGVLALYLQAARRAARELRWALVKDR